MKKITVYSTPFCHFCHLAKDFFNEHNIRYEEIDVSVNNKAAEEIIKKTGQMGVPVIIITDDNGREETLIGFQEKKLKELLNI